MNKESILAKRVEDLVYKTNTGDGEAAYALVQHFDRIEPIDSWTSVTLLRRAAELGSLEGQYEFGLVLLDFPEGGKSGEGKRWLRRAARRGHKDAIEALKELKRSELEEKHGPKNK